MAYPGAFPGTQRCTPDPRGAPPAEAMQDALCRQTFPFPARPLAPVHGSQCNASGIILRRSACLSACSPSEVTGQCVLHPGAPRSKLSPSSVDTPSVRHRPPTELVQICRPMLARFPPAYRTGTSSEPADPSAPPQSGIALRRERRPARHRQRQTTCRYCHAPSQLPESPPA